MINTKLTLNGFKYFKNALSRFNGIKLSGIKFFGFSFIYHKNEYTTLYIYFLTLCFSINLWTNDDYDTEMFHYYGPERKILGRIKPWYTDFFGLSIIGREFIGIKLSIDRIVRTFKPTMITDDWFVIKLYILFYQIEFKINYNTREN